MADAPHHNHIGQDSEDELLPTYEAPIFNASEPGDDFVLDLYSVGLAPGYSFEEHKDNLRRQLDLDPITLQVSDWSSFDGTFSYAAELVPASLAIVRADTGVLWVKHVLKSANDLDAQLPQINGAPFNDDQQNGNNIEPDGENIPLLDMNENHQCNGNEDLPIRYASRKLLNPFVLARKEGPFKKTGLLHVQLVLATLSLCLNLGFSIWAMTQYPASRGVGTLYTGNCSTVKWLNSGAHVLLNIVSTLFLGAGNYCMQVLVAPSVTEIHKAHGKGETYEIGVQSMRNLLRLGNRRRLPWLLLSLLSVVLHLVWNSAIFASLPYVMYNMAATTTDYRTARTDWSEYHPGLKSSDAQAFFLIDHATNFTQIDSPSCIEAFIDPLQATQELVVVLNTTSDRYLNSSMLYSLKVGNGTTSWPTSQNWICTNRQPYGQEALKYCGIEWARTFQDDWTLHVERQTNDTNFDNDPSVKVVKNDIVYRILDVEYCLVGEPADQENRCSLRYSFDLLIFICVCTFCELLLILWTVLEHRKPTTLTACDLVAETLKGTVGAVEESVAPKKVRKTWLKWNTGQTVAVLKNKEWSGKRQFWFTATGIYTWAVSMVCFLTGLGIASGFYALSLHSLSTSGMSTSPAALWAQGFGSTNGYSLVTYDFLTKQDFRTGLYANVLFANSFQLLLSFEYLFCNNILTHQLVAKEVISYMTKRKPLRVSRPENTMQRETYFLSLPWQYAIPQMVSFAFLHWLVSQSVFLVQIDAYEAGPQGARIYNKDTAKSGFSTVALLLVIIYGSLILGALLLNSFLRRYEAPVPRRFPAMACNSSAIVAMCQRPTEDTDAYLYIARLAIVKERVGGAARLTFTSDLESEPPVVGQTYEHPAWL